MAFEPHVPIVASAAAGAMVRIRSILGDARNRALQTVNSEMVAAARVPCRNIVVLCGVRTPKARYNEEESTNEVNHAEHRKRHAREVAGRSGGVD